MNLAAVADSRKKMLAEFDGTGIRWCQEHAHLADRAIAEIFEEVAAGANLAVAAVGGYGREELVCHGDLDIVFLPAGDEREDEEVIRRLFRSILDMSSAAGWNMDYAIRYPSDTPGLDDKSRTALLDARWIAGSQDAFTQFMEVFTNGFPTAQFLADKRRERLRYRDKLGYTPQLVEFNLRDGTGGLRDYQAAAWFRMVLGSEPITGLEAHYDRMLAVRNALQWVTGRKEDRLIRTRHSEVAARLGMDRQEMFSSVMVAAKLFRDEWRKARQLALEAIFALAEGVEARQGKCVILPSAMLSEAATGVVRGVDLDMEIPIADLPNREVGDGPAAASLLAAGTPYLRAIQRSGVLAALIPDFAAAEYLLPEDSVHQYTVGEHTMVVAEKLQELRSDPAYEAAWSEFEPRTLTLAAILHDLGKIDGSAPHSVVGAKIAARISSRLNLAPAEAKTIEWLVAEHLTLATIARTHDLQMPAAPLNVAQACGDQSRLAMLYLLTIADIDAVSPDALTPQLLSSIRDLYEKARSLIGEEDIPTDPVIYRNAALEKSRTGDDTDALTGWLETMPTHYIVGTPRERFPSHFEYVKLAEQGETTIVFENNPEAETTDMTICCKDLKEPGLLSRILGVLFAHDLTVHGVRAASTIGPEPVVLDQITVSYRGGLAPKRLVASLPATLRKYLTDREELEEFIRKHHKDADQPQQFLTYRFFPGETSILEVETPIGMGMPYRVTRMLAHFGWNVYVARIGQWAGRAVARFYLADPNGPLTGDTVSSAIDAYKAKA